MTLGALRAKSAVQFGLVGAYRAAIVLIVTVPPTAGWAYPPLASQAEPSFGDVPGALGKVLGMPNLSLDARLMGLLSFVYTYHYLNWFIKADLIRWNQMPRGRLAAIALGCVAATGLYIFNFDLDFTVLLLLSLTHVLLVFPLNSRSLRGLGQLAMGRKDAAPPPPSSPRKGRRPYPAPAWPVSRRIPAR